MNLLDSPSYETFLPIPSEFTADEAPACDGEWLTTRGINSTSPIVLKTIRDEIPPLLAYLNPAWFCFLIHDKHSGVPVENEGLYIHFRYISEKDSVTGGPFPMSGWLPSCAAPLSKEIAGVDPSVLDIGEAWEILGQQSVWFLDFLKAHPTADGLQLVKHTRQFLHFFANMAQMRVA